MIEVILRLPEVRHQTGLARSTIYARIAQGTFPRPIALGERAVGWTQSSIAEWIELQVKRSRTMA
jgi:prophage regulatory protein